MKSDDVVGSLDFNPEVATETEEPASGSAERSLRLLSLISDEGQAMSLAELTVQLGLPKGTVHRLCTNLVTSGYLVRDTEEKMFSVGPALRQMAFNSLNRSTLRGMRHAVLKELVEKIGETCNFTTLDGTEVLYLDRVEARWPLRLTIDVGSHVPLHCTSSGKLLLACMSKRQRDIVIKRLTLTPMTKSTIIDPEMLKAECDAIVECGYACDDNEFVEGLVSIAVPVRDSESIVRATVSVHAPVARMSLEEVKRRIDLLLKAAKAMERLI